MNCETCGLTFMRLNELRRHAASGKHKEQTTYDFSCLPCALPLHNIPDIVEHVESAEHSIMSLAADNQFDTLADSCDSSLSEPFPPLYFCMLCSCRDNNPYGIHLKSVIHKNIARLMRTIFRQKTIHYTNDGCDDNLFKKLKNPNGPVYCELCNRWSSTWYSFKEHLNSTFHKKTQVFMNKLINVKQNSFDAHACDDFCFSFSFACELCNIHFNSHESYNYHLENKTHKRVERFLTKINNIVINMDVIIRDFDLEISETFSNSLPPLYYCELCELFSLEPSGYIQHSKGFIHKRIDELFNKLSDKRKGNVISLCLTKRDTAKLCAYYCKLCIVGFSNASDYGLHLNDKGHLKIEHFINFLTNEGDINFINIYIDAQIQTMFGNSLPPNYCDLCNILFSKSEKFQQHLVTDEHKQAKQSHLKNNCINENRSKRLKKSSLLPDSQTLDNVQGNSVMDKANSCEGEMHQDKEPLSKAAFSSEANETNSSYPSWPGFATCVVNNCPPLFRFEAPAASSYPSYPCHAPYGNYSPFPYFQAQEPYGYYPSLPNFQVRMPDSNCPPWSGFQAHAYTIQSYNPYWPGFFPHTYANNSYNPPWSVAQPPTLSCENPDLNICPGTEVLESNRPPQQCFEDSSVQIGLGSSTEMPSSLSPDEHFCELCNYECSNSRLYEKHLKGEKHKKLRKLLNKKDKKFCLMTPTSENAGHPLQYNCELCDVFNPNASQYENHLATSKHKKNQWLLYVLMQRPL